MSYELVRSSIYSVAALGMDRFTASMEWRRMSDHSDQVLS